MNRTTLRSRIRRAVVALAPVLAPAILTPPAADAWALLKTAGAVVIGRLFGF